MNPFIYILIVVVIALIAALAGIYLYVFYTPNKNQNNDYFLGPDQTEEQHARCVALIDKINSTPHERICIKSFDGLKLAGRYFESSKGAPLAIMFHGYRGTPSRDFSGGSDICLGMGYNVLIIEERGHCSSEGHTICFGIKERRDVLSWIEYALNRFGEDQKIILVGISMGAATVLMSSGLGLPGNIKGIIADCPYSSPLEIIEQAGKSLGLPMKFAMPFVRLDAKIIGGFSLTEADAETAVKGVKIPMMIIHGGADLLVPKEMSEKIAKANPEYIERHVIPGAGHGMSFLVDTPLYTKYVKDFCLKVLN